MGESAIAKITNSSNAPFKPLANDGSPVIVLDAFKYSMVKTPKTNKT